MFGMGGSAAKCLIDLQILDEHVRLTLEMRMSNRTQAQAYAFTVLGVSCVLQHGCMSCFC